MITLALGVPKMGKTQALMDYVSAHAHSHRFMVVCRAGDWLPEKGRYRTAFELWTNNRARLHRMARNVGVENLLSSNHLPWFGEAPKPDSGEFPEWLMNLPDTGVFRFGYPWEGLDVATHVQAIGDTTYVDDEIDEVGIQPRWQTNPLRQFCHRGRHLPNAQGVVGEVHILGAARRAQSLAVDLTNLADQVFVFRVQGFRTLQRLVDDRILEKEEVTQARKQKPYHYKLWQSSGESSWGRLNPLKGKAAKTSASTEELDGQKIGARDNPLSSAPE